MRLLLDEMLSPTIAGTLRARGHDVEAVTATAAWAGLPDAQLMEVARAERRAIVTNNVRDFRPLHHDAVSPGGQGHFGMVFLSGTYRRTKADVGRIVAALEAKLTEHPGLRDLTDRETWL